METRLSDDGQPALPHTDSGRPLLDQFEVSAFRGIRDLSFEQLGRVNLLVGKNNSGKTSVLEALALYASPLDLSEWSNTAQAREARTGGMLRDYMSHIDAIRWMFPHNPSPADEMTEHFPITLAGHGETRHTRAHATCVPLRGIRPKRSEYQGPLFDDAAEDRGWLIRVSLTDNGSSEDMTTEFPLWSTGGFRYIPRDRKYRNKAELLPPYSHRNLSRQLGRLTEAMLGNKAADIDNLLRDLDRNILGTEIITTPDGQRPVLAVRHRLGGVMPVNVLGDGVRRALSIALAIPRARDGLLLIDEVEAALHVSALDRLYPWLEHACRAYNVQLFATTHSLEAIDAIARIDFEGSQELAAYRIDGAGATGEQKRYTGGMLKRLVHEQGLDVR